MFQETYSREGYLCYFCRKLDNIKTDHGKTIIVIAKLFIFFFSKPSRKIIVDIMGYLGDVCYLCLRQRDMFIQQKYGNRQVFVVNKFCYLGLFRH